MKLPEMLLSPFLGKRRTAKIAFVVITVVLLIFAVSILNRSQHLPSEEFRDSRRTVAEPNNRSGLEFFSHSNQEAFDYFADVVSLPSCGDKKELLFLSPLQLEDFTTITPLGLLSPTAHVFPSQHLYFNVRGKDPRNYNSLPVEVPVVAPANITITQIKFVEAKGRPDYNDSMIGFGVCHEFKAYFDHLKTLAAKIKQAYDAAPFIRCDEYSLTYPQPVGTVTFNNCEKLVNIVIQKGEPIGTAGGGEGQKVFDFGAFDKRIAPKQFANSKRWRGREHFVYLVCSLDYYPEDLKSKLKERLGGYGQRGEVKNTDCGEVIQDIPGTAMGAWVPAGTEFISHEPPYLALVHDYIEPEYLVFSMGDSAVSSGLPRGKYTFLPESGGLVNRHFKEINSDGRVYCFETEDTYQANVKPKIAILVTMPSPITLRIQKLNAASCGQGPWSLTNYTEFER